MALLNGNFDSAMSRGDSDQFIVRHVLGMTLQGDVVTGNDVPLQRPHSQGYVIAFDQIFKKFDDGHANIRDLSDFFIAGDRFGVKWDRRRGRVVDLLLNVEGLRRRRGSTATISKIAVPAPLPAFGFVIKEEKGGLLIWSKLDGGSLVYAPMASICSDKLRNGVDNLRSELLFPPVAIMAKKASYSQQGPHFTLIPYETISVHAVSEEATNAYFPSFPIEGTMNVLLGDSAGAILHLSSSQKDTGIRLNPNRPLPLVGDCVYCPPWSFMPERSAVRWQENCRLGVMYKGSCVFIHTGKRGYAYGCGWIALSVKLAVKPSTYGTTRVSTMEQRKFLANYQKHEQEMAILSDWNADDSRRRILNQLISGNGNKGGHFETNCRALCAFMECRDRMVRDPSNSATQSGGISQPTTIVVGGKRKKRNVISSPAQTSIDLEFCHQTREWFRDMGDCFPVADLEEFGVRFETAQRCFN